MDLHFRRAKLDDKEAVLNILTAFGGRDYLPSKYNEMITDPSFVGVVTEIDRQHGDMVGFAGAYIVNRGTTMSTKGSRVREDLQGQGVYRKMWNFLKDTIYQLSPRLKYEEFTVSTQSSMLKVPEIQRKTKEFYRRPVKYYSLPASIQHSLGSHVDSDRVVELYAEILHRILANESLSAFLFPKRLVLGWNVYRPIPENSEILSRRMQYTTRSISPEQSGDNQLVLFGTWFKCEHDDSLAYNIDCYGKSTDEAELTEHFRKHAKMAFSLSMHKVSLLVFGDSEMIESVNRACVALHFTPMEFFSTHNVVMVRDLDDKKPVIENGQNANIEEH